MELSRVMETLQIKCNRQILQFVVLMVNLIKWYYDVPLTQFNNDNRIEWSTIPSVIIRVITKSEDRAAGVQFVYHEHDLRPN